MRKIIGLAVVMLLFSTMVLGCAKNNEKDNAHADVTLESVFAKIEAVNPIEDERIIDDFSIENELKLNMENIVDYTGKITNVQADCSLIFVAEVKTGKSDEVKKELEAYKSSLSSNDLYVEFAEKIAKAKDARIKSYGNYVVMVVAGVGADYSSIDTAMNEAFQ